jgi:hypothetical protein
MAVVLGTLHASLPWGHVLNVPGVDETVASSDGLLCIWSGSGGN